MRYSRVDGRVFDALASPASSVIPLRQGIARVLSGDLDGGDLSFEEALDVREEAGTAEVFAGALCERSLVAMARHEWGQAGTLAGQADAVLRQAGLRECYVTSLVCAVQARVALHGGDAPAARQQLVRAQRLRPLLTYAIPHLAVQARIELTRAHLALADLAGARMLMREIGAQLFLSLHTVKSQAYSLYRKLSVASRSQAVGRSREPGLLEG